MHKKRKSSRVHVSPRKPMKKCAMKMKGGGEEKNDTCVKIIFMEGSTLQHSSSETVKAICANLREMIMNTMKVLFVK